MGTVQVTETFPDGTVKTSSYDYDENKEIVRQILENQKEVAEREKILSELPVTLSEQSVTNEDIMDAITELGDLISQALGE